MAPTSRIRMVGKALVAEGCRFTVLNIGAGPCPNPASRGTVDGIQFEYLPGPTLRPDGALGRKWLYAKGLLQACAKLYRLRRTQSNLCAYLYFPGDRYAILRRFLRGIRLPVIQDVSEWWPGFRSRLSRDRNLRFSQGTLAISHLIIDGLKALPSYTPAHRILRIPILIDPDECSTAADFARCNSQSIPHMLWCGNIDLSGEDIQFLLRVCQAVNRSETCRLIIVGQHSESTRSQIFEWARAIGLDKGLLDLTGFVPDEEYNKLMSTAAALLLPLWETERSTCRFPTKLAHYLASARPIVTTGLGDLTMYLKNGHTAFLVPPNDVRTFSDRVTQLLRDKEMARSMGIAGWLIATEQFSVQANKTKLARFFREVAR
jgi:glycosyltransferase involved in cell wall biosynthesis